MKIGRNDPCHCGSGQKYKKCCAAKDDAARSAELAAQAAARSAAMESAAEAQSNELRDPNGAVTRTMPAKLPPKPPKGPPPPSSSRMRKRSV